MISGNTFGAKIFSDGKRIAPKLPDFPNLTKCKKCHALFWLSKLKEIGTFEWRDQGNSLWQNADTAKFLEIDDYFDAINKGIAENKEEELILREQLWWAYNDKTRNGQQLYNDESDKQRWRDNVEKLLTLLDQSDINQKITMAEIKRNLGDFKGCITIIESIDNNELDWFKEKIINECKRENRWVIELA